MKDFRGKIGVLTGAGTGIGRALARQLVREGCHMAICDIHETNLKETSALCLADNPHNAAVTSFVCDVTDEPRVMQFLDHVRHEHKTDHINLLINNAGINGGGSFVESTRDEWERTFNISWSGVYLMTRTFLPLLLKSTEGHLVNMSSANALRAVLGGHVPHTAYSAAKFAVRGFSEALIHDFRFNAPHLGVSVVMPGAVSTEILSNSARVLGHNVPKEWTAEEIRATRARWKIAGRTDADQLSDSEVRAAGEKEVEDFRRVGLSAEQAAQMILEGVRNKTWRILLGKDTESLDALVRASPERAYDPDFVDRWRAAYDKLTSTGAT